MKTGKPKKPAPEPVNGTAAVDEFMARLKHPLKAEAAALRAIIKAANPKLGERVKWNAPSFFYKRDLLAFNLYRQDMVRLVFVFYGGTMIHDRQGLLEGEYGDRRLATFRDMADVRAKQAALVEVVNEWVTLMDQGSAN